MKYSDRQRIRKVYEYATKLQSYLSKNHIAKEQLLSEFSLQWLVTTPLYNMGEQVYQLSSAYKKAHGEVEWNLIAGLRHRLVHDYDGTNWNIIADAIFEELPILIAQLETLVRVGEAEADEAL